METTNPTAEVVTQETLSPEERLESLFTPKTKPAQEAKADPEGQDDEPDEPEVSDEAETESEAAEGQADEETTAEEADTAEIDIDGETYVAPKKLAERLRDLEAGNLKAKDYTQKTQKLAERERFLDQMEQHRGAVFEKAAELKALDLQIDRFKAVDWTSLAEQGGPEYLKLDRAYRELSDQRARLQGEVQQIIVQRDRLSAQERQQQIQQGNEELAREIKGWSPEYGQKLLGSSKHYGFTDEELSVVTDPRYVRVLHDAHQWRELQKSKQTIVQKKVSQAKPVTVKAARSAQTNQQAQQNDALRARAKKTGDGRDAEAFLARLFESKRKR